MLRRDVSVDVPPDSQTTRRALAWAVHAFTASGGLVAVAALLACARGDLRVAALWMLVALLIDAVDGTLARRVGVSEVLPGIDGRRLDDIVDYVNYVIVPAVFMVQAASVIHPVAAAAPVIASAYGFSQVDAKTEDHFFVGFPSYWNVVAIYLWALAVPAGVGTALLLGLSAAVFIPLKYVYPSRMTAFWRTTNAGAAAWTLAVAAAIAASDGLPDRRVMWISLAYPVYYVGISFWLGGRHGKSS
jgi:phosphatidylcholine synthase